MSLGTLLRNRPTEVSVFEEASFNTDSKPIRAIIALIVLIEGSAVPNLDSVAKQLFSHLARKLWARDLDILRRFFALAEPVSDATVAAVQVAGQIDVTHKRLSKLASGMVSKSRWFVGPRLHMFASGK